MRKKKGVPPTQNDTTTAAVNDVVAPAGSAVQAVGVELRTRQFVRHIPAHSAVPDPYAFDVCDEEKHVPDEGSQHDPAFLESLVARSGSSLSDDVPLDSASPPERRPGGGLPNGTGAWPAGRCALHSHLLLQYPACCADCVGTPETRHARGRAQGRKRSGYQHEPRRSCSCTSPVLGSRVNQLLL